MRGVPVRVATAVVFVGATVALYAAFFIGPPRSDELINTWVAANLALHLIAGAIIGWWALLLPVPIVVLLYSQDRELPGQAYANYLFSLAFFGFFPTLPIGVVGRWVVQRVARSRR